MALDVIEKACDFTDDMARGVVVVESGYEKGAFDKAFEELQEGVGARNLAIQFATRRGMGNVRLNGNVIGPYPVDAKGIPLDEIRGDDGKSPPQTDPRMRPVRYRITIPVCRSLT